MTSLANLNVNYIDSLLLHSPIVEEEGGMNGTLAVWKTLEIFVKKGTIKQLGISNINSLSDLKHLWNSVEIKPAVVQNRFHRDTGYDVGIREFCLSHKIFYQSFWTLTANPHIIKSPVLSEISKNLGRSREQVFFRALMKMGIIPLSGTTNEIHMLEDVSVGNLEFDLTSEDVSRIEELLH